MPASRHHIERVKLRQQVLRPAAFLNESGALSPLNPALNGIFVEASEQIARVWTQIKSMQKIFCRGLKGQAGTCLLEISVDRTKLQIPPLLTFQVRLQFANYEFADLPLNRKANRSDLKTEVTQVAVP